MRKIMLGIFLGLVLATFAPYAADLARAVFDTGRAVVAEILE